LSKPPEVRQNIRDRIEVFKTRNDEMALNNVGYGLVETHTIDEFRYVKIQPKTIHLSTSLWGINVEFVGFIPQSLVLRSIVLG